MELAHSRKTRQGLLFESLQYYSGLTDKQSSFTLTHCDSNDDCLPPTIILKKRSPLG